MKKIVALVTALVMVMSVGFALATGSKSGSDIPTVVTEETEVSIEICEDSAEVADMKTKDAATVIASLPEDVVAELGEMTTINEIITIKLAGDTTDDVIVTFAMTTPYEAGTEVKLVFHFEDDTWTVIDGAANADGDIEATIPAAVAKTLTAPATMIVVSK